VPGRVQRIVMEYHDSLASTPATCGNSWHKGYN
jgi:hypothetical protein